MDKNKPWGVHTIHQMMQPGTHARNDKGSWGPAVAMPYPGTIQSRIVAAWWVLTGKAEAIVWPEVGDLHAAIGVSQPKSRKEKASAA
jgi:hypothetical protein